MSTVSHTTEHCSGGAAKQLRLAYLGPSFHNTLPVPVDADAPSLLIAKLQERRLKLQAQSYLGLVYLARRAQLQDDTTSGPGAPTVHLQYHL